MSSKPSPKPTVPKLELQSVNEADKRRAKAKQQGKGEATSSKEQGRESGKEEGRDDDSALTEFSPTGLSLPAERGLSDTLDQIRDLYQEGLLDIDEVRRSPPQWL